MSKLLFDFNDASALQGWTAIDDRVMGRVSRSSLEHDPAGHAVFKGVVSLERNGGFASVRSSPGDRGLPRATEWPGLPVRGQRRQQPDDLARAERPVFFREEINISTLRSHPRH